jgi:Tol biopolymer transport system component
VLQVDTTNPVTARVFPTSTAIDVNQIAVSPDGLTLFMLGYQGNARLSQVFTAPASNPGQVALLSGIDSASFMGRFALSPDGSVLYLTRVLDVPGGTVAIDALDLSTRTTVGSISLPGLATGANGAQIVSTPLGGVYALWSSGDGESSVSYVDPVANQLTSIGIYEQYAASLTSSSDGTQVFVSFAGDTSSQIFAYSSQ